MQNSETESPLPNLAATVDGFRQYVNSNHVASSVKDIAKYYRPEDDPNSEYVQLVRNHTKTEIKSITGRMFEVLNEYEDAAARDSTYMKGYISDLNVQLEDLKDPTVKGNIQLLITDYKELCSERESLLYSLQEWFDQKHIEDSDLPDMHMRRGSVMDSARLENYHQTLQEGREVSIRLRGVQDQMEDAAMRGDDVDIYKDEKQRLETDLVKSKLAIDDIENEPDTENTNSTKFLEKGHVDYFVNQSWKNAAADICSMLKRVRKSGLMDVQEMEEKLQGMTEAMNEQDTKLATLNEEQIQYKKKVSLSEERATDLASENGFLIEEVDRIRADLYDSKKKMTTIERQHVRNQKEIERTNTEATNELKQQITSLNKENGSLKAEIAGLKLILETYSTARKTNTKSSKTNGKSTVVVTTKLATPQVTDTTTSNNSKPPVSGTNNDALLRLKDQLLEERDNDVKRLQEQLESDSRELNNRLTVVTNENGTLRAKIAELEMTIATMTIDIHQISMASPSLPIDHDKVVVISNTPRAPPPTPDSHTHFTSTLNNDGITPNVHVPDNQGIQYYHGISNDTTRNGNQSNIGGLENGNQAVWNGNQAVRNGNQAVRNGNHPRQNGNQAVRNGNQPRQNGNQAVKYSYQPVQNRDNSQYQNGNRIVQNGIRTVQNGNQARKNGNQSFQNGNQPRQNGNQTIQNGNRTVQNRRPPVNQTIQNGNQTAENRVFTMVQQPTEQMSQGSEQTIIEEVELVDDYGNTLTTPTNHGGTHYLNTGGGGTTPAMIYYTPPSHLSAPLSPFLAPPSPLTTPYPLATNVPTNIGTQQYLVVPNDETDESLLHEPKPSGSNDMPVVPPRSTLPKPERNTDDAALDIVVGLMDKLNKGGRAEEMGERNNSTAMRNINTEMNKMVDYIQSFMKDSLSLVDNEVESMNKATNHLLSNLTEREKLEAERKAYQALEDQELDRKRIREKVLKFGQDAIKVLREGEAVVQSHVVSEQTKLSSVVSVMADHKKRQPKNFRFPLPGKRLFLETQSTRPRPLVSSDTTTSRIEAIIKMAEERGTPLTTGNVSVMGGAQQQQSGVSDLNVTTRTTPMLRHKGQNHRNKRTDTSNGLAVQQGRDGSKVFNPFKSRAPTWGFLQNKPATQNVTPPTAGPMGGTKRGEQSDHPQKQCHRVASAWILMVEGLQLLGQDIPSATGGVEHYSDMWMVSDRG